jgi:hypothetical protein
MNEAEIISRAEASIPADILLQLEIKLLLEKGLKAVDKHHRNLVKGKNDLLEGLSGYKLPKAEMNKINEAFKSITDKVKASKLNEDEAATLDASSTINTDPAKAADEVGEADWDNVMKNIESTDDLSGVGEGSGGMLGMLKSLMGALTEGGSMIGILHLVLDIVGLVGDFFGPVGLIADVINGLIYMFRAMNGDSSKWILALISFAAAVIPFAGNIMKGMFQVGKTGKTVVKVSTEYIGTVETTVNKAGKTIVKDTSKVGGSVKISDDAIQLLAKAGPESSAALKYIGKASKKSLPAVKQMIDGFFKDFLGMIVGWVPFLGKPLKKFFASIADMFDIFFKKSTKFADDIPEILTKVEVTMIDDFFKAAGGKGTKMSRNGDKLVIRDAGGAHLAELEGSVLKGTDFLSSRYGPDLADQIGQKYIKRTQNNVLDFYEGLSKNMTTVSSKYGKVFKYGAAAFNFSKNLTWFIGKQVAKLLLGFDPKKLSNTETEMLGTLTIHQAMEKKRQEEFKKNPKAKYVVPILDSVEDKDSIEVLNRTLQKNADRFNMGDIGVVAYASARHKDDLPQDVQDFFNFAYENRQDEADYIEDQLTPKKGKSKIEKTYENESFKHIRKFKL